VRQFKDLDNLSDKIQAFLNTRARMRKKENFSGTTPLNENYISTQLLEIITSIRENNQTNSRCIICLDLVEEPILTFCMHSSFCTGCLKRALIMSPRCPHCKTELNPDKDLFQIPVSENFQELYSKTYVRSAKIQKLLEIVQQHPTSKIVVFSHFISMMEMVRADLQSQGVRLEYINGATPEPKRKELIRSFKQDHSMQVLLISIKVGGFGLNLTEANIVIILEPWWNPAIEDQAVDRVNRIGQKVDFIFVFLRSVIFILWC
jgi:DNA repair protein RAD5